MKFIAVRVRLVHAHKLPDTAGLPSWESGTAMTRQPTSNNQRTVNTDEL